MATSGILLPLRHQPLAAAGAITGIDLSAWAARSFLVRDVYAESPSQTPPKIFSRFGGQSLGLESSEYVNHNTKRLRFAFPNSEAQSGLTLTYEPGSLDLLVKRYPNGKGSGYLHSLTPGSTLLMIPLKGYTWKPNAFPHLTLIAGGAGITPISQLTQGILRNPDDQTKIPWYMGIIWMRTCS